MSAVELEAATTQEPKPVVYVGRVGVLLFALPAHDGPGKGHISLPETPQLYDNLLTALRADPRVKELRAEPSAENTFRQRLFSFAGSNETWSEGRPSMPHRHVHVASFVKPILFSIHVPKRLQPQDRGGGAIPSEEYWVSWDGVELVVLWDHASSARPTGHYGGFIALDVLDEAAKTLHLRTMRQACGPYCDYPFSHQDLLIAPDADASKLLLTEQGRWTLRVDCPAEPDVLELVRRLSVAFSQTVHTFALFRSFGASVSRTEGRARRDLTELLRHQYEIANTAAKPLFKSIPSRWKNRQLRRQMARLIATLWLRLATLEETHRHWSEGKFVYETSTQQQGLGLIFRTEYPQSLNSVDSVELNNLRSTVEQLTIRADTRVIAFATVAGALAGALVGGLASVIGLSTGGS
jgi:hypothetical protein